MSSAFKGSPAHVSTLTSPTTRWVSDQLCRDDQQRGADQQLSRVSCRLSATGIGFLGILSRRGVTPLLRSAYRTTRLAVTFYPDHGRVSAFRTLEQRPVWVPSEPRGHAVLHGRGHAPGRRVLPLPGARPYHPVLIPSTRAFHYEASSRVHSRSPARSSPSPVAPGWIGCPLRRILGLRTPQTRSLQRTPRWETGDRALARSYTLGT
jgi:hypothetical protein